MTRVPPQNAPRQWLVRSVADRTQSRAVTVWRPPLNPVLKRPLGVPPAPSGPLWPYLVMVALAVYAAAAAEFSGAEWPLYLLVSLPAIALAYDSWSRRGQLAYAASRMVRPKRIVADRRPILMQRVLFLPDQRPARLIRKLEPKLSGPTHVLRIGYAPANGTANGTRGHANGSTNGHLTHATRGGRGRIVKRTPNGHG
ncbi:MAG: hypothetical protein K2Y05_02645 [Hyphomicrobiaceae bacterium]|nr:hypothetical protein [Hyphomicrobiaceae bacterium]